MALSKTGRFLSKAEILGVWVFYPLSNSKATFDHNLKVTQKWLRKRHFLWDIGPTQTVKAGVIFFGFARPQGQKRPDPLISEVRVYKETRLS